jgi:hypothetical protein
MKTHQIHGVMSLALVSIAILLAAIALFMTSAGLGIVYILGCAITGVGCLYGYCAKCPCKGNCGHVLPGRLAQIFRRPAGPYTGIEYGILIVSVVLLFGFPQIWLWQYPKLFAGFWGCAIIAGIQIFTTMCRVCENMHCPMNRSAAES